MPGFLEHLVDRHVEKLDVSVHINSASCITVVGDLAFDLVKPAALVGFLADDLRVFGCQTVGLAELAVDYTNQVGNGLEALDPADGLSDANRVSLLHLEVEFDDFTEHARRESRQPDPPSARRLFAEPEVGTAVPTVDR